MPTTRIEWLVSIVLALSILSLVLSLALLIDPFHFANELNERASLSQAVSTALALLLGTIAVVITVSTSRGEFRAQETLREDLAKLAATLHVALNKSLIVRGDNVEVSFDKERDSIGGFLVSTSGFAMICWIGKKSAKAGKHREPWRSFILQLSHLSRGNDRETLSAVQRSAVELIELLEELSESDVKEMASFLGDLGRSMTHYQSANTAHPVLEVHRREAEEARSSAPPLPPDDVLAVALKVAESKSAGLADEIRQAIASARSGDADNTLLVNGLVQILLADATERPEPLRPDEDRPLGD